MGDIHNKEPLQPNINNDTFGENKQREMPGMSASNSGSADFGYEELSNGLTCPTCQGTGKIPRGQEDDLVALIPYRDDRLKPRRTALYVCIAVFVCMAIAGILCAFLIPRPIEFVDDHVDTIKADLNVSSSLNLTLMNIFNVSNHNFLALQITNASTQVISTFKGHVVNKNDVVDFSVSIPLRSKSTIKIPVTVQVHNDDFPLTYCDPKGPTHGIYMIFTTTIYYQFMFQNSQSTITHYQLVNCAVAVRRSGGNQLMTDIDERRNNLPNSVGMQGVR